MKILIPIAVVLSLSMLSGARALEPIPGKLVTVQLRGPVRNAATGALEMAATWTNATKVPGTEDLAGAVYQGMWRVPNGIAAGTEIPFETRLLDSAGTETIARVTP